MDAAELIGQLVGMSLIGGITAWIASYKGRSPLGWFFISFLTGGIGLIVACCMGNLRKESAQAKQVETETRRLREQLQHERIKTEAFHSHIRERIDAHDTILGMDTRSAQARQAIEAPGPRPVAIAPARPRADREVAPGLFAPGLSPLPDVEPASREREIRDPTIEHDDRGAGPGLVIEEAPPGFLDSPTPASGFGFGGEPVRERREAIPAGFASSPREASGTASGARGLRSHAEIPEIELGSATDFGSPPPAAVDDDDGIFIGRHSSRERRPAAAPDDSDFFPGVSETPRGRDVAASRESEFELSPMDMPPLPGAAEFEEVDWFVKFGERKSQALDFEKLTSFWRIGNLTPDKCISTSLDERWVPIRLVPGLLDALERAVDPA